MSITVTQLFRYPVKSMGGHSLNRTPLTAKGIPGDRAWALKDEERGGIKGGKRFPELLGMNASFVTEPSAQHVSPEVNIALADGRTVSSSDQGVNEVLSAEVGAPVSLWPLLPAEQVDHYLRPPLEEESTRKLISVKCLHALRMSRYLISPCFRKSCLFTNPRRAPTLTPFRFCL